MLQQLSSVSIVLFVAAGVQTVLVLFIFAKRQIMRFSLRSKRGPHTPIAHDTRKSLRKEIDRRIQIIPKIDLEPRLEYSIEKLQTGCLHSSHYYRLKTINDFKILDSHINDRDRSCKRHPKENVRRFLIDTLPVSSTGNDQHMVHEFCDFYEHARHDPSEFRKLEYEMYSELLMRLSEVSM